MDKLAMNFTPFYILANVRSLLSENQSKRMQNWVLAMKIFAVGSTTANRICHEAGIDPEGCRVVKIEKEQAA